jgi:hypothetical protein
VIKKPVDEEAKARAGLQSHRKYNNNNNKRFLLFLYFGFNKGRLPFNDAWRVGSGTRTDNLKTMV